MIDLKLIYQIYIENINLKLIKVLEENVKYQESHAQLKELLMTYGTSIQKYSSFTLEDILKTTDTNFVQSLRFPLSPVYKDGKQINFKAIKLYIEKYIWCNNVIVSNNKKVTQYKEELISFSLYNRIISEFNSKIIDKIINNNYLFNSVPSFGAIGVIKNFNERKRPNWGESNKKKAEIIARGGIPYIKADAESVEDYKGEKWLSYHPSLDFYLHWHTKWISKKLNPFLKDYTYKPARGKNSIVSKLQNVKQNRDTAKALYNRTLN